MHQTEHRTGGGRAETEDIYGNYADLYKIVKPILKSGVESTSKSILGNTQRNSVIQKVLSKADCDNDTISYVSSLVCKNHSSANAKQTIHTALVAKYGKGKGLNLYNHVKKYI